MTKQEKIAEAYGEHWEKVKDFVDMENGACCGIDYTNQGSEFNHPSLNKMGIFQKDNFAETWFDPNQNKHFWRPKTLDGITSNNGWIKIESEESLPKKDGEYKIWYGEVFQNTISRSLSSRSGIGTFRNGKFILIDYGNISDKFYERKITHWKEIIEEKPPIF